MNDEKNNVINPTNGADLGFEVVGNDAISSEKISHPVIPTGNPFSAFSSRKR